MKNIVEKARKAIKSYYRLNRMVTDQEIMDEFLMLIRRRDHNILFDNDKVEVEFLAINGIEWEQMEEFVNEKTN